MSPEEARAALDKLNYGIDDAGTEAAWYAFITLKDVRDALSALSANTVLWLAYGAVGDSPNDPQSEIVGVFSDSDKALKAAKRQFPRTGERERYILDSSASDPVGAEVDRIA